MKNSMLFFDAVSVDQFFKNNDVIIFGIVWKKTM